MSAAAITKGHLWGANKAIKRQYKDMMENNYNASDSLHTQKGLQVINHYKSKPSVAINTFASLQDEPNNDSHTMPTK